MKKMCITIHIPKGEKLPDLRSEISSARNIKDRTVRNNTITGLNRIISTT